MKGHSLLVCSDGLVYSPKTPGGNTAGVPFPQPLGLFSLAKGSKPPRQDFRAVTFVEQVRETTLKSSTPDSLTERELNLLSFMTWATLERRDNGTYMSIPVHFNLIEDLGAFLVIENGIRKIKLAYLAPPPPI